MRSRSPGSFRSRPPGRPAPAFNGPRVRAFRTDAGARAPWFYRVSRRGKAPGGTSRFRGFVFARTSSRIRRIALAGSRRRVRFENGAPLRGESGRAGTAGFRGFSAPKEGMRRRLRPQSGVPSGYIGEWGTISRRSGSLRISVALRVVRDGGIDPPRGPGLSPGAAGRTGASRRGRRRLYVRRCERELPRGILSRRRVTRRRWKRARGIRVFDVRPTHLPAHILS